MKPAKQTIAIVLNTAWNVYNFRLTLLKSLQSEGYRIVVIAPHDSYVELLKKEGFEWYHLELDNDSTNTLKEIKLISHLHNLYKEVNPDILLHYTIKPNIYGNLVAAFLGIPTINNISGLGTVFLNDKASSKIARTLYKLTLRFSGEVFFQNRHDMELFLERQLIKEELVSHIPGSGIDTDKFAPIEVENKSDKFIFLFIARLIKDKGIVEYIDAIKELRKKHEGVVFQVIGDLYEKNPTSVDRKTLKSWIDDGLIEYHGYTDDIRSYIAGSSCIVLPSYREGLSRSLLEASSMAKPMVTTDVPGCNDIVEDGLNGFLCKARDAKSLADAMDKMLSLSETEREHMGLRARDKVVKNFHHDIVINKYKETIQKLLSK